LGYLAGVFDFFFFFFERQPAFFTFSISSSSSLQKRYSLALSSLSLSPHVNVGFLDGLPTRWRLQRLDLGASERIDFDAADADGFFFCSPATAEPQFQYAFRFRSPLPLD